MIEQNNALLKIASGVKLFAGMERSLLVKLLSAADKAAIAKDALYFNEGDSGESFYVLIAGQVSVEQTSGGKWVQLATLKPGDSFGEMTLVDEKIRSARVKALSDCVALFFPMQRLKASPDVTSALYLNIAKVLVKRLKSANVAVLDLTAKVIEAENEKELEPIPEKPDADKSADAPDEAAASTKAKDAD